MKKIILAFFLLTLGVSKAQIVGGYLPVNSTKSFTAGNSTFSNVIARGTLSVSGTSTLNSTLTSSLGVNTTYTNLLTNFNLIHGTSTISMGSQSSGNPAIWLGGGADATNYTLGKDGSNIMLNTSGSNIYFQTNGGGNRGTWNSTGLRVGSGSPATAVLDVTGDAKVSSTFSLGSANLTGGNTGTVAVLSDVIGYFNHAFTTGNQSNNQSYIIDDAPTAAKTAGGARNYIPKNITITNYNFMNYVQGTPSSGGTTGTLVLQVNGTNTNTLSTAITWTSGVNTFSGTLTQTVASGSYLSTLLMTPNFTVNPTNVMTNVQYWFKQ